MGEDVTVCSQRFEDVKCDGVDVPGFHMRRETWSYKKCMNRDEQPGSSKKTLAECNSKDPATAEVCKMFQNLTDFTKNIQYKMHLITSGGKNWQYFFK